MINLLAPNDQRQLAASRTNSLMLRYVFLTSIVIVVMSLEMLGVFFILKSDQQHNQELISFNNEKAKKYDAVQKQADEFTTNLAISKYILGKQIPYTSIVFAIAQVLPASATLDSLSITPALFGSPVSLSVETDSPSTAITVKAQLQSAKYNSQPIFTAVSFDSITAPNPDSAQTKYKALFNVTFSKGISTQ